MPVAAKSILGFERTAFTYPEGYRMVIAKAPVIQF